MIEQINLIPDEIRRAKKTGRKRPLMIGLLVFYLVALGAVYFYQKDEMNKRFSRLNQARKERDMVIAQNIKYKEVIERINRIQQREEDIKKRLNVIGFILEGRIYWSEILRNITHLTPHSIWLTSLSTYDLSNVPGKGIKFNGTALSNSAIAEFIFSLENSQFLGNILLGYSQKRELQGRDLYDFEITADIRGIRK